jgi:hypothetical protein
MIPDSRKKQLLRAAFVVAATAAIPSIATGHNGGILIQVADGQLVTGLDNEQPGGTPDMDERVFSSLLRPDLYGQDLPSFLSLSNPPANTAALPPGASIYWDFLPMTINGVTSNLFYWDGAGTMTQDVQFNLVPQADVSLGIYNVTDGGSAIAEGTPEMVPGALLGVTDTTGSGLRLHRHNWFLLDDGDGGIPPTLVPEGVYLIAIQLRMDGYIGSEPIFIVSGTYELISTSLESLNAAVQWVQENVEALILEGDYDFDGDVDADDYGAWRAQSGATGPFPVNGAYADGNRDGIVDAADYVIWRANLAEGSMSGSAANAPVPEPSALVLLGWGIAMAVARGRRAHTKA